MHGIFCIPENSTSFLDQSRHQLSEPKRPPDNQVKLNQKYLYCAIKSRIAKKAARRTYRAKTRGSINLADLSAIFIIKYFI